MSGILNNKTRIMETVLTQEGKRHLSTGKINFKFVTFTDSATFYEYDAVSGSVDVKNRIMLEPSSLPYDVITFGSDENGLITQGPGDSNTKVSKGKILIQDNSKNYQHLSSSAFSNQAMSFLSSSIENFNNLRIIGSTGMTSLVSEEDFELSPTDISFIVTHDKPISAHKSAIKNINSAKHLLDHERLSHVANFEFLPPRNKDFIDSNGNLQQGESIGTFFHHNQQKLTSSDILRISKKASGLGYEKIVDFTLTSRNNNVFAQMFEIRENSAELHKLEIIDYGRIKTKDSRYFDKHIFFAGKVFVDKSDRHVFIHLFTLIFE